MHYPFWKRLCGLAACSMFLLLPLKAEDLFRVKIVDENLKPIPGSKAQLVTAYDKSWNLGIGSQWHDAISGEVTFTTDDHTTAPRDLGPIIKYTVLANAPGYPQNQLAVLPDSLKSGDNSLELKLRKGKEYTIEFTTWDQKPFPDGALPGIVLESLRSSYFSNRSTNPPTGNVTIPTERISGTNKFRYWLAEDSEPALAYIDIPGFLQGWESTSTLSLTETSAQITLPRPVTVNVTFNNPYADQLPADTAPELEVTSTRGSSTSRMIARSAKYQNPAGKYDWVISDLAPGTHHFSASAGIIESRMTSGMVMEAGSSDSFTLQAHSVIPPVVATDENGTTITDAEGFLADARNQDVSHVWQQAQIGLIQFRHSDLQGRYAGDKSPSSYKVIVRAPGYAIQSSTLTPGEPNAQPVAVKLETGRIVTATLLWEDGTPTPETLQPVALAPEHYPGSLVSLWQPDRPMSLGLGKHLSGNKWQFHIPKDVENFRLALDAKEILRTTWSAPYTDKNVNEVEWKLPRPGALQVDITVTSPTEKADEVSPDHEFQFNLNRVVEHNSLYYHYASFTGTTTTLVQSLPPGKYTIKVSSRGHSNHNDKGKSVTIESGTTTTEQLKAVPATGKTDRLGRQVVEAPLFRITDENGKPVTSASLALKKTESRSIPTLKWYLTDSAGICRPIIDSTFESPDGLYDYIVKSPGHATYQGKFAMPAKLKEIEVKLKTGKKVSLQFTSDSDRPVPSDLITSVFPENFGTNVWLSISPDLDSRKKEFLQLWDLKSAGNGSFNLNVDEASTIPLYLLVNHPDYLRAFQAGPFVPSEWITSGTVTVALPKPASVTLEFNQNNEKSPSNEVTLEISRRQKVPGANHWRIHTDQKEFPIAKGKLVVTDLTSGDYNFKATLAPAESSMHYGAPYSDKSEELAAGDNKQITLTYQPFKEEWVKGPYTAKLSFKDPKGNPPANATYKLTWQNRGYETKTVAEGKVPESGLVEIKNLAGLDKDYTTTEVEALPQGLPNFTLYLNDNYVGQIQLFDRSGSAYKPLPAGVTSKDFEFSLPPSQGDPAPDFEMVDLVTSETVRLKDFAGQVVLIDFWATWCGPCQGPMAENQAIMRKHQDDWKGKATILAVSIDDEKDTVQKHLAKNGWDQTRNTWAAPAADDAEKAGWQAPASKLYGITSIPTMILIDKDGTIRQRGHIQDIEKSIENLLE